jgi:hypothetical protein
MRPYLALSVIHSLYQQLAEGLRAVVGVVEWAELLDLVMRQPSAWGATHDRRKGNVSDERGEAGPCVEAGTGITEITRNGLVLSIVGHVDGLNGVPVEAVHVDLDLFRVLGGGKQDVDPTEAAKGMDPDMTSIGHSIEREVALIGHVLEVFALDDQARKSNLALHVKGI